MKFLVTGGSGFIGAAVVAHLHSHGHAVVTYDSHDGKDILDQAELARQMKGVDKVIHLAGILGTDELFEQAHRAIDVNIHGALNVLEACHKVGASYTGITMPQVWKNVYQTTKQAGQNFAEAWNDLNGLPVSHVRAYNAFGTHQKVHHVQKIVPTFATRAWRNEPLPIWGDGTQGVDLVHVSDVAAMLVDATAYGDLEVFDAGTGVSLTVNEVADMVISYVPGSTSEKQYFPMRRGEKPTHIVAEGEGWDTLGWHPGFSEIDLAEAVDWYREDRP